MNYKTTFYCPTVIRLFHTTKEEFLDILLEKDDAWDNSSIPADKNLLPIISPKINELNDTFSRLLNSNDDEDYSAIKEKLQSASLSEKIIGNQVWIASECTLSEEYNPVQLKELLANVLAELSMNNIYIKENKDIYFLEIQPYELYNQTNCAAPVFEKNRLQTAYEIFLPTFHCGDVYTSADFQCDQTEGFPTSLCVNWDAGKTWLELNESLIMNRDEQELEYYRQLCADWGIRKCECEAEFNEYLRSLGDEAYDNAALPIEEEGQVIYP